MRYSNFRPSDRQSNRTASPKQRSFLVKHLNFTPQGAAEITARNATKLIAQKISEWNKTTAKRTYPPETRWGMLRKAQTKAHSTAESVRASDAPMQTHGTASNDRPPSHNSVGDDDRKLRLA